MGPTPLAAGRRPGYAEGMAIVKSSFRSLVLSAAMLSALTGPVQAAIAAPVVRARTGIVRIPALSFATGDVIAISEMRHDPTTLLFEAATASRYGHVGIVTNTEEGLEVYHSMPPYAQKTPLAYFLNRAQVDGLPYPQFTLLRHAEPLTRGEREGLVDAMKDMVARRVPFNYSWAMNPNSVNCSQFVRRAFEAIGRSGLGELSPISLSNFNAFDGALIKLFKISLPPGDTLNVSPTKIVHSPQLKVVHAQLPVGRMLSDAEIFKAWKTGGGLAHLAQTMRIPIENLEAWGKGASDRPFSDYPSSWRRSVTGL